MRIRYFIVLTILLPIILYGQENDSTKSVSKKIFVSVGITWMQYYSDKYFDYLHAKTASPDFPSFINPDKPLDNFNISDISNKFNYNKSCPGAMISIGLNLECGHFKNIHFNHIIETSYSKYSGEYSDSAHYKESGSGQGGPAVIGWSADIFDAVQAQYTHSAFSLGYKFQPTFKSIFFSIGINAYANFIKVAQQRNEQISGVTSGESGVRNYSQSKNSSSNATARYVNFPLELGMGGNYQIKRIILRPSFYFTPSFMKGYNLYTVLIGIHYNFKKP